MYQKSVAAAKNITPAAVYYIDVEGRLYCRSKVFAEKFKELSNGQVEKTTFENFDFMVTPTFVVQKDHKTKKKLTELTENEKLIREGLKKMILDKHKSLSSFAAENGFDKSDLSKFLKGQKDWQLNKFFKLMTALKSEVVIHEEETPRKGEVEPL